MDDNSLVAVLNLAATGVAEALDTLDDWSLTGGREGEHHSDLAADEVAVGVLLEAGLGVLSEESGTHGPDRRVLVVVDPLDGSTNAAQGIPWYATSLCALDDRGARAAVVRNLVSGTLYEAVRGDGATRDGKAVTTSGCSDLARAILGVSGYPGAHLGWRQFRAFGSASLDLCAVAEGVLDGFVDFSPKGLGPWDYLGGALVCAEAGATVVESAALDLVVRDHEARRSPIAAASADLAAQLVSARQKMG